MTQIFTCSVLFWRIFCNFHLLDPHSPCGPRIQEVSHNNPDPVIHITEIPPFCAGLLGEEDVMVKSEPVDMNDFYTAAGQLQVSRFFFLT